jgi:hypothetical protein
LVSRHDVGVTVWEASGQLYESTRTYDVTGNGWSYELQALRGRPGDGPGLYVFVPDDDRDAATVTWHGSARSMPLAVMRWFLAAIDE